MPLQDFSGKLIFNGILGFVGSGLLGGKWLLSFRNHYLRSKRRKPQTKRHGVTSKNTWILSNTALSKSNLKLKFIFLMQISMCCLQVLLLRTLSVVRFAQKSLTQLTKLLCTSYLTPGFFFENSFDLCRI